jgi:hypothetical protein
VALVIFAGFSLNIFLSFGLGLRDLIRRERVPSFFVYYPWLIVFTVTFVLWLLFAPLSRYLWFPAELLFYPLSLYASLGLEKCLFKIAGKRFESPRLFSVGSSYNCFSLAALFLCLSLAFTVQDAILVSFAFSAGGLGAFLIVKEIQKQSFWEILPYSLRGASILLIAAGLLAMVIQAAAVFILKALPHG